jgi:replication factor C large subunit
MIPLIEKYRAKSFSDIKGQDQAISDLRTFFKTFPKKKSVILNGPAGTGKTSMVIALAKEMNMELFELNASDLRNRQSLDEVLKPSSQQQSLFKRGKVILMDEADGITGTDRGGLPELIALIDKTSFPIIITANDIWQQKFSLLRRKSHIIGLKELKEPVVLEIIKSIVKKENRIVKNQTLELIAKKSRGDVRAALNDLQVVLAFGEEIFKSVAEKQGIQEAQLQEIEISEREKTESIFDAIKRLFQDEINVSTITNFDNVDLELDEILLWIEENIPYEYQGKALAKAYDSLSKADVFRGRIYRQQYYRFLVYQNFFLTAGISSATKIKNNKFVSYKKPQRILKIWLSNQKNIKKKSIVTKYAQYSHMSKKKAMKEYAFLPLILDRKAEDRLDLDENERQYLEEKKGALIVSAGLNRFR